MSKLVLAGGVAANSHLRAALEKLCREKNVTLYLPDLKYCGDNAAMIGAEAYFEYKAGVFAGAELNGCAVADI